MIDSPAAERRLDQAARALDAASSGGVPSGGGTAGFTAARQRTDERADKAFTAARDAAARSPTPPSRPRCWLRSRPPSSNTKPPPTRPTPPLRSVQRGVASLSAAVSALGTAQRLQAQQAYDLAEAAVDALTLRAPVSGVVQLGGTTSGGSSSLTDLLGDPAAAAAAGAPAQAPLAGVDTAVPRGAVVGAGTPILTIVDTGRLGLAAEVDETDVLLVQAGGTATAELDAATGATYEATVRAVDLLPTTSARGGVSYRVRLTLGKGEYADGRPAPTPRPGMSAIVRLQVRAGRRRGDRAGVGGRLRRRPRHGLDRPGRPGRAGPGHPRRAGRGRRAGRLRHRRRPADHRGRRRPGQLPGRPCRERQPGHRRHGRLAHVRPGRRLRARPARRVPDRGRRRLPGHRRHLRLRQVHPHAPARRPGPAHRRHPADRRPRRRHALAARHGPAAQRDHRLRLPVVPPARPHHRPGQRRAAAGLPRHRPPRAPGPRRRDAGTRRPGPPHGPPAQPDVRR